MAAIDHGADAVYIGAARFGARAAAGNSIDDIRQLCAYAHTYGAKVYVTVNTILMDGEINDTQALIHQLYQAGADALLVQDMGVLNMQLPPIALHASTQIIIAPGYEYKIVRMLVTNFHQPQSTLLLLVSAFLKGDWKAVYSYALSHNFRFLSYGDSSLLIPPTK